MMRYFAVVLAVMGLDMATKRKIAATMQVGEKKECIKNKLYFWHMKNKGAAYNIFEDHPKALLWGIFAGLMGVTAFFLALLRKSGAEGEKLGAAFMVGGGLANFLERAKHGAVTDFIYVKSKKGPIFNVADLFLWAGCIIFCIAAWFGKNKS